MGWDGLDWMGWDANGGQSRKKMFFYNLGVPLPSFDFLKKH